MSEPRKDPYRVRRDSRAEFSRVTAMLKSDFDALNARVEILEEELKTLKRKFKRTKSEDE